MLKKWFISAFPEIEKISQTLAPKLCQKLWKIELLMKRCIGSAKPHRSVFRLFARYYDAEEVIHKRISWNSRYLKLWPQSYAKNYEKLNHLMKRCIGSAKPHRSVFRFFARYYDAEEVIHKRISWNREDISNSGPKAMPKIIKEWTWSVFRLFARFNEKVHRIRKTSQKRCRFFRFFARYYDAEEVIHQRISWNREDISNSGPKAMPKIMKNWTFNEKVHRIRKTSQKPFFAFLQDITMLKKWFISAFPEIEKISQTLAPKLCQKLWKNELLMKRCIGSAKPHRAVFRFFARYYDAEEVIHQRISWNWEDISNSGPKAMPKIMKN